MRLRMSLALVFLLCSCHISLAQLTTPPRVHNTYTPGYIGDIKLRVFMDKSLAPGCSFLEKMNLPAAANFFEPELKKHPNNLAVRLAFLQSEAPRHAILYKEYSRRIKGQHSLADEFSLGILGWFKNAMLRIQYQNQPSMTIWKTPEFIKVKKEAYQCFWHVYQTTKDPLVVFTMSDAAAHIGGNLTTIKISELLIKDICGEQVLGIYKSAVQSGYKGVPTPPVSTKITRFDLIILWQAVEFLYRKEGCVSTLYSPYMENGKFKYKQTVTQSPTRKEGMAYLKKWMHTIDQVRKAMGPRVQ